MLSKSSRICSKSRPQRLSSFSAKVSQRLGHAVLAEFPVAAREGAAGLSQSELARRLRRLQVYAWRIENAQRSPDQVELMDVAAITAAASYELNGPEERTKRRC